MKAERNLVLAGGEIVASVHASRNDNGEAERLARLFAAALELLEACQVAFGLIGLGRQLTDAEATHGLQTLMDAMRKAEAKP